MAPLLGIVILGAGLRFFWLGHKSLWLDEAFSLWMAQRPPGELWGTLVDLDQHPPLFYGLLALWRGLFGDSEAALRALSALAGIATLPVFFLAVDRLLGRTTARMALLLLAISPFQIAYAQEARMYALLCLAAAVSLLAVATLGRDGWPSFSGRPMPWMGLVLAQAAALWLHNTAIFLPVALTGAALALGVPRRRWLMAQAAVGMLWLPWLPGFLAQARSVADGFWIAPPTVATVFWVIADFGMAYMPGWLPLTPYLPLTMLGLVLFAGVKMGRRPGLRSPLLALLSVLLVPVLGSLLASLVRPIFLNRTLIWAGLPYLALAAWGIVHLPRPSLRRAGVAAVVGATLLCLINYYVYSPKEDWRTTAHLVADLAQPGDLVLFNAGWTQLPFDYYFERSPSSAHVARRGLPADLFERGELEPVMLPADLPYLDSLIQERDGVWLVYSHEAYTDPDQLILAALEQKLTLVEQWPLVGIHLKQFAPPN